MHASFDEIFFSQLPDIANAFVVVVVLVAVFVAVFVAVVCVFVQEFVAN